MMQALKENKFFVLLGIMPFLVLLYKASVKKPIEVPQKIIQISTKSNYFTYSTHQLEQVDSLFCRLFRYNVFNGSVLIGQKDSVFYKRNFGYANLKQKTPLTDSSIFQLSSVSKQFTAVAILQLYERNLLNLTDTVDKFIPNFPYKGITIHMLLTHRSGLPNYHYFLQHIPTYYDTIVFNYQLIDEMVTKQPQKYYRPNRRYQYSNTGYALLASIVEKVAGCSFDKYIHKNIFKPLGMSHSYTFLSPHRTADSNLTTGYLTRRKISEDNYLDGVLGDKGIYCSPIDLFKWDQGLYNNIIIQDSTLQKAFKPMGKPKYFPNNYGYGWRMFHTKDSVKILYHAGWWHGYKSLIMRIPSDTATIIILKNESSRTMVNQKKMLEILYPKNKDRIKKKC